MSVEEINDWLDQIARSLRSKIDSGELTNPVMIGIHTGGVWLAERLHERLGISEPLGVLNISFYRDDFTRVGINPQVKPSKLPGNLDNRDIILVDDVIYTGRTIRAALNEIFDYGRPARVVLVVMLDRGGRELPFEPDIIGKKLELKREEQVKLTGPDPLDYIIQEVNDE